MNCWSICLQIIALCWICSSSCAFLPCGFRLLRRSAQNSIGIDFHQTIHPNSFSFADSVTSSLKESAESTTGLHDERRQHHEKELHTLKYPHGMTERLYQLVEELREVPIEAMRYQQLFHFAETADPMDNKYKIPSNKVLGCQSTVYVHCTAKLEEGANEPARRPLLYYAADSDSMLTKGLVSLLVKGLSGHTLEEILRVDPEFIRYANIEQSLTPGRNSGLLNMLNTMKHQAKAAIQNFVSTADKG